MRRDIDYKNYDPQRFAQDHPYDPYLEEGRQGANQIASNTPGRQEGESLDDARSRANEEFNNYGVQFDRDLDKSNITELRFQKDEYFEQQKEAINDRWDKATSDAKNQEQLEGSQGARNDDLDSLQRSYNNDFVDKTDHQEQRTQLENFQAARSEAASHEIGKIQDQSLANMEPKQQDNSGPDNSLPPQDLTDQPQPGDPDSPQPGDPAFQEPSSPPTPQPADPAQQVPSDPELTPTGDPNPPQVEPSAPEPVQTIESNPSLDQSPAEYTEMEQVPTSDLNPTETASLDTPGSLSDMQQSEEYQQFLQSYDRVSESQPPSPELNQDQSMSY